MARILIILSLAGVLFGCATSSSTSSIPVIDGAGSEPLESRPLPEKPESAGIKESETVETDRIESPAVVALLGKADRQKKNKQFAAAAASLERAIRISPRNPELYLALAGVRLQQGDTQQANQLCNKAIALANDGGYIRYHCRELLND